MGWDIPNLNTVPLDTAAPIDSAQNAEMNGLKIIKQRYDNATDEQKKQVRDVAVISQQLMGMKDPQMQAAFIEKNRAAIGEHADEMSQALAADPAQAQQMFGSQVKLAQLLGAMEPPTPNENKIVGEGDILVDSSGKVIARGNPKSTYGSGKPMTASAIKTQNELIGDMSIAEGNKADTGAIIDALDSKKLDLGPIDNLVSRGLQASGMSTQNSRNFETFKNSLEARRNASLRLNKGTQTEGDSERAWNEIMTNLTDNDFVSKRLKEVQNMDERASTFKNLQIDQLRSEYGLSEYDPSKIKSAAKPSLIFEGGNIPEISGPNDPNFAKLPAGAKFKSGGKTMVKH